MKVFIPTTKKNDCSKNIIYPNVMSWGGLREAGLNKLGLTPETLVSEGFGFQYSGTREPEFCINLESVCEAHHFGGSKLAYLKEYGIKTPSGWALTTDKAQDFLNGNIPSVKIAKTETINISVCQENIAKVGGTFVQRFVAFNDYSKDCVSIVSKAEYNHSGYNGQHININVTRSDVIWGTESEILDDIKGIIFDHLNDEGRISDNFLTFDVNNN